MSKACLYINLWPEVNSGSAHSMNLLLKFHFVYLILKSTSVLFLFEWNWPWEKLHIFHFWVFLWFMLMWCPSECISSAHILYLLKSHLTLTISLPLYFQCLPSEYIMGFFFSPKFFEHSVLNKHSNWSMYITLYIFFINKNNLKFIFLLDNYEYTYMLM